MIYRFGPFKLDTAKVELRSGGEICSIEPQVFALLTLLVDNRERLVSKDEIIEKVWDGRVVSEAAGWAERAARAPGAHVLIALIAVAAHALGGDEIRAASWAANVRSRATFHISRFNRGDTECEA